MLGCSCACHNVLVTMRLWIRQCMSAPACDACSSFMAWQRCVANHSFINHHRAGTCRHMPGMDVHMPQTRGLILTQALHMKHPPCIPKILSIYIRLRRVVVWLQAWAWQW